MDRRDFVLMGAAAAAAGAVPATAQGGKFGMHFAPHFGMFRAHAGDDPIDQLKFMADQGFTALEDNGMRGRPPELQQRIGRELERLGMRMGVFVAHDRAFGHSGYASGDPAAHEQFLRDIRASVDVAKRVNAKWCTIVPGERSPRLEMDYQTGHVIDLLRKAAEIWEPHGLVMVMEPLNPWRDHPNMFLTKIPQAHALCRAVNSPSCKILFDIYHQQITEGNLIPNMDLAWSEIAYFQIGDNPGRREPTTGEINYANVFRHIKSKGFQGILGMEHGNSRPGKEGERAVIDAYRACDPKA